MELAEWNRAVVDLVQVLAGMISQNMRMIVLDHDGVRWRVLFVLERDDPNDREEIEDVPAEYGALQSGPAELAVEVKISDAPLSPPVYPARVIFWRREW